MEMTFCSPVTLTLLWSLNNLGNQHATGKKKSKEISSRKGYLAYTKTLFNVRDGMGRTPLSQKPWRVLNKVLGSWAPVPSQEKLLQVLSFLWVSQNLILFPSPILIALDQGTRLKTGTFLTSGKLFIITINPPVSFDNDTHKLKWSPHLSRHFRSCYILKMNNVVTE